MRLEGNWKFRIDPQDVGMEEKWFQESLQDEITIGGILQNQGYGETVTKRTRLVDGLHDRLWFLREEMQDFTDEGQVGVPFCAQPVRHYLGAAWYQKELRIPEEWKEKELFLFLELVRWNSKIWIDDQYLGEYRSLCVPHQFFLGHLEPGKHILTIRVDNRNQLPYRPDAHGVSDSVGHTWNGIVGRVELIAKEQLFIEKVEAFPLEGAPEESSSFCKKTVRLRITVQNLGRKQKGLITFSGENNWNLTPGQETAETEWKEERLEAEFPEGVTQWEQTLSLGEDALLWDEFLPALQRVCVRIFADHKLSDSKDVTFGLRKIQIQGRHFLLNGRIISFRGTHDGGCFPLTGYPAMDVPSWRRIFSVCKEWGLNHVRFHSWCPPEAAFCAADEMGMYLQIETGMWNYFKEGGEIEEELFRESDRILETFGNHPSFLLFSSGNEPHGAYKPIVKRWVETYRKSDSRHLYCAQSGWLWPFEPQDLEATDYLYTCSRYNTSKMRGKEGWFGSDYRKYMEDIPLPFLCHELGQYGGYPDFSVIEKFTGYLRPENYKGFRKLAERAGVLEKNKEFVKASGILQFLAYKEEIEANLRTPQFSGFSLLDLHDYLGQGGALVGLLDAFWESKGVASPEAFRMFCAPTVPLARLRKVIYTSKEELEVPIEIACYEKEALEQVTVYWRIEDTNGKEYLTGTFPERTIQTGGNTDFGKLSLQLAALPTPASYYLVVGVSGRKIQNRWKIWVYPEQEEIYQSKTVRITTTLQETYEALSRGEKVLFLPAASLIHYDSPLLSALPVFWNGRMGPKWNRNLGMLCDSAHAALREFPTEMGMEWQWKDLVEGTRGMNLEKLPKELTSILTPIDDWNRSYRLSMAFEATLSGGKLLVCSADLLQKQKENPAAKQLLYSFLHYMESEEFQPNVEITRKELESFLADTTIMRRLGAGIRLLEQPDSTEEKKETPNVVENLLDGDPNTYFLAGGKYGGSYPFTLELSIPEQVEMKGLRLMPRQNHRDYEGQVKDCEVYAYLEEKWEKVWSGELAPSLKAKELLFEQPIKTNLLQIRLLSGFGAEDIWYWDRDSRGFFEQHGDYVDCCVSLANLDILTTKELSAEMQINQVGYRDTATASEEIY